MPHLSASEVVFHEEALYQVYMPLPYLYYLYTCSSFNFYYTAR